MDGKIATAEGLSKWITGESARNHVQTLRNKYMGIMVGIGTVIKDNPMLNCRIPGGRNPIRIVCDSNLSIPLDCNLVNTAKDIRTIVATIEGNDKKDELKDKLAALNNAGIELMYVKSDNGRVDLRDLMYRLGELKIDSILLEGGGNLNYSALKAGIVNEALVYMAPKIFGGKDAISPVEGEGVNTPDNCFEFDLKNVTKIDNDILLTYTKKEG